MNIPNILSLMRIVLIPIFVVTYLMEPEQSSMTIPGIILIISAATDVLDGYIARKYNMITDLGKILDPLADKLTQITVCACLTLKYPILIILLVVYVIKEGLMLIGGAHLLRKKILIRSSRWFGKLSTVLLYSAMFLFLIISNMPDIIIYSIVTITALSAILAFVLYVIEYRGEVK